MPKISLLPSNASPALTDLVPEVNSSTTKQSTWSAIRDLVFNNLPTTSPATGFDYVASGLVITADSAGVNRNWSITAGVCYIGGQKVTVAALSAQTATASRDTYVDVLNNGDGTGTLVVTGGNIVTNNAASPALAGSSLRAGIIVAGASTIAAASSINQGQEDRILPIASSIAYSVTDSLGNLICPRDPARKLLGYRFSTSDFTLSASQTTQTQITGLSCPVLPPPGRKIKITITGDSVQNASAAQTNNIQIWDGVVGAGTSLSTVRTGLTTAGGFNTIHAEAFSTAIAASSSTSLKTYNAGVSSSGATNVTVSAGAGRPVVIKVELM